MRRPSSPQRLKTYLACLTLVVALAGCQKSDGGSADASATSAGGTSGGACDLLKSKEVQAVFPGAKAGEIDSSREQYGIFACTWATSRGTFVAQYWDTTGSSAKDEARGLMLGAVDPLKGAAARNNVRYEDAPGVGPGAVAVIETRDEERGVLTDFAMLVAESGDRILVLIAPELARSARADALKSLESLGKNAAGRLADVAGAQKAGAGAGAANQATPSAASTARAPASGSVHACNLITPDEMIALVGKTVAATADEGVGRTGCVWEPQGGGLPRVEVKIEWGMGEAAMAANGMLSKHEKDINSPYEGLGDEAFLLGPAVMIKRDEDLVTIVTSGVDDAESAIRKIYDTATARL